MITRAEALVSMLLVGVAAGCSTSHPVADAGTLDGGDVPSDPSDGCDAEPTYPTGTSTDALTHDGLDRTFRVHVPPGDDGRARPVVVMFHGGGGSGAQLENASSRMDVIADREGFVTVYPDGTGAIRTWNGDGCCGSAAASDVDDVGFVSALLDHLEATLCVDRRRIFAAGMSNGAILTHRLACSLADRLAAVAPVAGTDMTSTCTPTRPIPIMQIHGSDDGHVPWEGGLGCGPANVAFTSVPTTIARWQSRNGCASTSTRSLAEGDGFCERSDDCDADVVLCTVEGGGHSWPGGEPNVGVIDCPEDGAQSTTFDASEVMYAFFAAHPRAL